MRKCGERIGGLHVQRALIFLNRLVIFADLASASPRATEARTRRRGLDFSRLLLGSMVMPLGLGRPNVSMTKGGSGAGDQDFLRFGISFGIDPYFHRHAEGVEVLMDFADHSKPLGVR